jgi:CBS domain-containing protein
MKVSAILQTKSHSTIWSVSPESTVFEALQFMAEKNIGALVVLQDGQLVGIFSERDYARKGIIVGRTAKETHIHEVMTKNVITITTEDKIEACMQIMSEKHIRHLPVVEKEVVMGMVSITDIVTAIINDQKNRIASLESYISGGYS